MVLEVDPQDTDPTMSVGQLLGADGSAAQVAAWSEVRKAVYGQLGSTAAKTGTVLEVVADVGVPSPAKDAEIRGAEQAAALTDIAAGKLEMQVGSGPAETYQTAPGLYNMVLYVTEYAPDSSLSVNFALATQPKQPTHGLALPAYPPYW